MAAKTPEELALTVIAAGKFEAAAKAPYFRPLLAKLVFRSAPGIGSMATSRAAICRYDPVAVATWSKQECAFAVLHECSHLWHRHLQRLGNRHPVAANIAMDMAINPDCLRLGLKAPFRVAMPADLGMTEGLAWEQYYPKVANALGVSKAGEEGAGSSAKGGSRGKDPPPPGMTEHGCGSCTGRPHPAEGEDGDAKDPDGRTDGDMARAAKQAAEQAVEHARQKGRGTVPAGLLREAEDALRPPRVPWQQRLGHALRAASSYRAGAATHRFDAPGRRQWGIGFGPGRPLLPRLRAPIPNVAFVFDTSGSIDKDELVMMLEEVQGVMRAVGGDVTVLACDAAVHATARVARAREAALMLRGGGGSDFRPAFDELGRMRPLPDVAVFGTDGDITVPDVPAPFRTIWLCTRGRVPTTAWGEAIMIDKDGEQEAER